MFTTEGWKLHGDLQVGDYVFDIEGNPTMVEVVGEPLPMDMELEFTNGVVVQTHSDHEWVLRRRKNSTWDVIETKNILTNRLGQPRKLTNYRNESNFKLPNTPRLLMPNIDLPMDPYVMGLFLGDGSKKDPIITHHPDETEAVAEVARRGYKITGQKTYVSSNNGLGCATCFGNKTIGSRLLDEMKSSGVFQNKHIPKIYFTSGTSQRLELLAGLIDSDGSYIASRNYYTISTTSKVLHRDYLELIRGLGFHASCGTKKATLYPESSRQNNERYDIYFYPNNIDIPVMLERKKALFRSTPQLRRGIKRVDKIDGPLGRCIQVASPTGTYLVTRDLIPTHNSELASISLPAWALGSHPDWKIIISSYSDKLPGEFSRNIRNQLWSDEYRKVFPNGAVVASDDAAVMNWSTTQGGGLRAVLSLIHI